MLYIMLQCSEFQDSFDLGWFGHCVTLHGLQANSQSCTLRSIAAAVLWQRVSIPRALLNSLEPARLCFRCLWDMLFVSEGMLKAAIDLRKQQNCDTHYFCDHVTITVCWCHMLFNGQTSNWSDQTLHFWMILYTILWKSMIAHVHPHYYCKSLNRNRWSRWTASRTEDVRLQHCKDAAEFGVTAVCLASAISAVPM